MNCFHIMSRQVLWPILGLAFSLACVPRIDLVAQDAPPPEAVLNCRVSFKCSDTPLEDAVNQLSKSSRLSIVLNRPKILEAEGLPGQRVTVDVVDQPIRLVLDQLIDACDPNDGLAWHFHGDAIEISPADSSGPERVVRIYKLQGAAEKTAAIRQMLDGEAEWLRNGEQRGDSVALAGQLVAVCQTHRTHATVQDDYSKFLKLAPLAKLARSGNDALRPRRISRRYTISGDKDVAPFLKVIQLPVLPHSASHEVSFSDVGDGRFRATADQQTHNYIQFLLACYQQAKRL